MLGPAVAKQQQYPCSTVHRVFRAPSRVHSPPKHQHRRIEAEAAAPPSTGLLPQQLLEAATLISTTSSADVISHAHARRLVLGRQPMLSDLMTAYTGPVETVLWKVGFGLSQFLWQADSRDMRQGSSAGQICGDVLLHKQLGVQTMITLLPAQLQAAAGCIC
jgi:hypothetical protein